MSGRRSQGGMTMLELLTVLALSAALVASLLGWWQWRATAQRDDLAADHAKVVLRAAQSYIRNNYTSLYNSTGAGVVTVPASALTLGDGMAATNAYGQTYVMRVIRNGTSLEGLVLYTGGQSIKLSSLRAIANAIGLPGGYVSTAEPNTAVGMMRQWTKALGSYGGNAGTGKVAIGLFVDEMTQAADDYLHRTATNGKPELNRMSTAIDMSGNDLTAAGAITANSAAINGVNIAEGGLATAALSIAKASFGAVPYPYETIQYSPGMNLRIYQGSTQRMVFDADGVNKFSGGLTSNTNVQAAGDIGAGGTLSGNWLSVNDAYATNWFRVRGSGGIHWENFGGGWYMGDGSWIRAYGDKGIYTGGQVQAGSLQSNGTLQVNGRATINEFVQFNGVANVGWPCSPIGLQGRDGSGAILSCVDGVWRKGGGIQGTTVVEGPGQSQGATYAWAYCPAGTFLVGGGYNVTWMRSASSQEAPQINKPDPSRNAWMVQSGAPPSAGDESRFLPYAVCAW